MRESLVLMALLLGCGSSPETDPGDPMAGGDAGVVDPVQEPPVPTGPACHEDGALIRGLLYEDVDDTDRSRLVHARAEGTDLGLADTIVGLLGRTGELATTTCIDGSFSFPDIEVGPYLLDVALAVTADQVATKNVPDAVPVAVRRGQLKMVTLGDSLPVRGAAVTFPEHAARLIGDLARVEQLNLAVSGTTSEEWLPGEPLFEDHLGPEIAGTDLFVVSLGGNDVLDYLGRLFQTGGQAALLEALSGGAQEYALQVAERVITITEAIHERNPEADIAYVLYPNYAASETWRALIEPQGGPAVVNLVRVEFHDLLIDILERMRNEPLLLVDLFSAAGPNEIDALLADEIHLSAEGHELTARELFLAVGGLHVTMDGVDYVASVHPANP